MEKIKLMIRVFIYINALFFMTFYLLPSSKVFASFTDSASLNAGLNLTLGNLDLSTEQNETTTGLTYLGGSPVLLSSHILKNKGTLNGKLAYKIQVTEKGTGTLVNASEMQIIMNFDFASGNKLISDSKINSADYTFVTDNKNNEWIFDGNQKKVAPVKIEYKTTNVPQKNRDIDITVTFLLVQTNASEPKETMFYDKISFKHELKLKAEEVPDPNYWPAANDENWKVKWNGIDEIRYNAAQFENIMYFSELESGVGVRNLNDNVLYIELPVGKLKEDNDFDIKQQPGSNVKVEVMKNRRFIKLTYSFKKVTEEAKSLLSQPGYQSVSFGYGPPGQPVQFDSNLLPLIHKRILLSSDQDIPGEFKSLPIYSTKNQQKISFKQIKKNDNVITDSSYLDQPQNLTEAKLNYKDLEAMVIGEPAQFDLSLHKADQKDNLDYLLINTKKAANLSSTNKNKLKIIITGNTGNKLVIYRDLIITQ